MNAESVSLAIGRVVVVVVVVVVFSPGRGVSGKSRNGVMFMS